MTIALSRNSARLSAMLAAITLAACGGGGDGGSSTGPKAEGAYSGTLTGGASSAFQLLVLENDEYWALYGTSAGNTFFVSGFIQGTGASNNGSFSSSNARDFGVVPAASGSVSATYVANTSIQGTVTAAGQSVSFSGPVIPSTTFNYSTAASVAAVEGSWNLTSLDGSSTTLTIASTGAFTGSSAGCNFSGTFTPRASGKNVFNVALTFGAAPCALPGQPGTGIAVTNILAGTTTQQLIVAGVNSARTAGTALFGTR